MKKTINAFCSILMGILVTLPCAGCKLKNDDSKNIFKNWVPVLINTGSDVKGWNLNEKNTGLRENLNGLTVFDATGADAGKGTYSDGFLTINGNQTLEYKIFTWRYSCDISAGGITFRHCLFKPTGQIDETPLLSAGPTTTFEDCEIDGSMISDDYITDFIGISTSGSVYRCNIHHCTSGIYISNTTAAASVVEGNYIHDLRYLSQPHMDGIAVSASTGAGGVSIRNNRVIVGSSVCTGAFFSQPSGGLIDNMTVVGNLFEGFGYAIYIDNHGNGYGSNIAITNNRANPYPDALGAFAVDPAGSVTFAQFSDNYLYDSSAADGKGALITQ